MSLLSRISLSLGLLLALVLFSAQASAQAQCRFVFDVDKYDSGVVPLRPYQEHLQDTGLGEVYQVLMSHSRGVLSATEFLKARGSLGPGYLLATDGPGKASEFFSSQRGLKHWSDGYAEYRIYPRAINGTPEYLGKITDSGQTIVFFVPPNILRRKGITHDEMMWLLAEPAPRMKNVIFVLGMYEVIPPWVHKKFNFTRDRKIIDDYVAELLATMP